MIPVEALLIVLRYLITYGSGWLLGHGIIQAAFSDELSSAIAQIAFAVLAFLGALGYALWKNTLVQKIRSLIKRDEVSTIHVAPEVAVEVPVPGVIASPPAPQ